MTGGGGGGGLENCSSTGHFGLENHFFGLPTQCKLTLKIKVPVSQKTQKKPMYFPVIPDN